MAGIGPTKSSQRFGVREIFLNPILDKRHEVTDFQLLIYHPEEVTKNRSEASKNWKGAVLLLKPQGCPQTPYD